MMRAAWHIAAKDLRLLLRDRVAVFWVFGFPLLFALFLGAVLEAALSGSGSALPIQLVTELDTRSEQRVLQGLSNQGRVEPQLADEEQALQAVRRGDAVAAVFVRALPSGDAVASTAGPTESREPLATIVIDPSREMEAAIVQAEIISALLGNVDGSGPALTEGLISTKALALHSAPRRASDYVFAPAVLWGLIGCAACFAISLVSERTRGTLKRLASAPLHRGTILLGKALACGIACLTVGLVLVAIAWAGFGVQFEYPGKLALALISAAICFAGITMLLSVLGKTEQSVAGAGWASLIVLSMFGGGMVPLSLMPSWMADAGRISPVRWGIVALEGALFRGFSYQELWQACVVLILTGGCAFALGSLVFSRSFE